MNKTTTSLRVLAAAGAIALVACATTPQPPRDALEAADISMANADKDHASDFAPLEMRTAHEKLAAAHEAAEKPDEEQVAKARPLADEARADADLAFAKAEKAKADAVNEELKKNSNTLRQEIQRGPGA